MLIGARPGLATISMDRGPRGRHHAPRNKPYPRGDEWWLLGSGGVPRGAEGIKLAGKLKIRSVSGRR